LQGAVKQFLPSVTTEVHHSKRSYIRAGIAR
jgi:hypothetical protein